MNKDKVPPFLRVGEVLREISLALGTKNGNLDVDRFARGADINWSLAPSLIKELVYEPLCKGDKTVGKEFANVISGFVENFIDDYVQLVSNVSAGNLSRSTILPRLIECYFVPKAVELLTKIHHQFGGVNPIDMLDEQKNPIQLVLDSISNGESQELIKLMYPETTDADRSGRENLRRWLNGTHWPDFPSLQLLVAKYEEKTSGEKGSDLQRGLIVARVIGWFEQKTVPMDIRSMMGNRMLNRGDVPHIGAAIESAVLLDAETIKPLIVPALSLSENLKRTSIKCQSAQDTTKTELVRFEELLGEYDPNGNSWFWLEWFSGRWQVLSGNLSDAIPHYQSALELAHYRAGTQQKQIIEEALALAGHLQNKVFLNKLKNYAIAMKLFSTPQSENVIEPWEIKRFAENFMSLFPPQGRFVEAQIIEDSALQLPFLTFDESDVKNKKPDLRNPDRVIGLKTIDGQIRRWTQLRCFASFGMVNAVSDLLARGASVDLLDESGSSAILCALQYAEHTGEREVLDLLLDQAHKKETLDRFTDKKQINPLFCAIEFGEPDVVKRLLEMGASADSQGNIVNQTPLYFCIQELSACNNPSKRRHDLQSAIKGDWDLIQRETMRRYGVTTAGIFGDKDNLVALLDDPRNRDIYEELINVLVSKKVRKQSISHLTEIVQLLLHYGAKPNFPHNYPVKGRTPLMLAAEVNLRAVFELCMKYGGNPYQVDADGADCRQIAVNFRSHEILRYFYERRIM